MATAGQRRRFHRRSLTRVFATAVVGIVAAAAIPARLTWAERCVIGWDLSSTLFLVVVGLLIFRGGPEATRRRAAQTDPGRTIAWAITFAASAFSLIAAIVVLARAKDLAPQRAHLLTIFCLWAVAAAWLVTHSVHTLRYAHLYYRDDGAGEGGLEFPGKEAPGDWDFAYFSFTVGMCFQVSDVAVSARVIRRTVLMHALVSFIYNTAILALALNVVFGRLG